MGNEYQLGKDFSKLTKQHTPSNHQKLLALLHDIVADDNELSSAFRLLFANPTYVSAFLAAKRPGIAGLTSLSSIAKSSLSESLASRVDQFVLGYFDIPLEQLNQRVYYSSSPESEKVPNPQSKDAYHDFSAQRASIPVEERTVFAKDDGFDSPANAHPWQANNKGFKSSLRLQAFIKPFLFIALLAGAVFASFKVPAICEPFGLCEKEKGSNNEKTGENDEMKKLEVRKSEQVSKPHQATEDPITASPSSGPTAKPILPPAPASPTQPRQNAPYREEPLW